MDAVRVVRPTEFRSQACCGEGLTGASVSGHLISTRTLDADRSVTSRQDSITQTDMNLFTPGLFAVIGVLALFVGYHVLRISWAIGRARLNRHPVIDRAA